MSYLSVDHLYLTHLRIKNVRKFSNVTRLSAPQKFTWLLLRGSDHRSETDAVSHTLSLPVRVKRVGREDGARCLFSFLVALACENDSSHFSLFSSLLRNKVCIVRDQKTHFFRIEE